MTSHPVSVVAVVVRVYVVVVESVVEAVAVLSLFQLLLSLLCVD